MVKLLFEKDKPLAPLELPASHFKDEWPPQETILLFPKIRHWQAIDLDRTTRQVEVYYLNGNNHILLGKVYQEANGRWMSYEPQHNTQYRTIRKCIRRVIKDKVKGPKWN